jgi:D-alanyl-D-alanine carboxypeptidase
MNIGTRFRSTPGARRLLPALAGLGRAFAAVSAAVTACLLVLAGGMVAAPGAVAWAAARTPAPAVARPARASQFSPAIRARLNAALAAAMAADKAPGAIAGVWQGNRAWTVARGTGDLATGAPMGLADHFRIASNTKAVVATAVLRLADQGRIGLNDPVSDYVAGVPEGRQITITQLLQHTSGLADYYTDAFQAAVFAHPTRRWATSTLLALGYARSRLFPPGTAWSYSNTGYLLLGEVIQKVTGQPLAAALQRLVFAPLGLRATSFPSGPQLPAPHAHGYVAETTGGGLTDITTLSPTIAAAAGAIVSTLGDLRTLATAIGDGALLTPATQRLRLHTVPIPDSPPYVGYGLGLIVLNDFYGHDGEIPGFISAILSSPAHHTTIVVMLNNSTAGGDAALALAAQLAKIIVPSEPWG